MKNLILKTVFFVMFFAVHFQWLAYGQDKILVFKVKPQEEAKFLEKIVTKMKPDIQERIKKIVIPEILYPIDIPNTLIVKKGEEPKKNGLFGGFGRIVSTIKDKANGSSRSIAIDINNLKITNINTSDVKINCETNDQQTKKNSELDCILEIGISELDIDLDFNILDGNVFKEINEIRANPDRRSELGQKSVFEVAKDKNGVLLERSGLKLHISQNKNIEIPKFRGKIKLVPYKGHYVIKVDDSENDLGELETNLVLPEGTTSLTWEKGDKNLQEFLTSDDFQLSKDAIESIINSKFTSVVSAVSSGLGMSTGKLLNDLLKLVDFKIPMSMIFSDSEKMIAISNIINSRVLKPNIRNLNNVLTQNDLLSSGLSVSYPASLQSYFDGEIPEKEIQQYLQNNENANLIKDLSKIENLFKYFDASHNIYMIGSMENLVSKLKKVKKLGVSEKESIKLLESYVMNLKKFKALQEKENLVKLLLRFDQLNNDGEDVLKITLGNINCESKNKKEIKKSKNSLEHAIEGKLYFKVFNDLLNDLYKNNYLSLCVAKSTLHNLNDKVFLCTPENKEKYKGEFYEMNFLSAPQIISKNGELIFEMDLKVPGLDEAKFSASITPTLKNGKIYFNPHVNKDDLLNPDMVEVYTLISKKLMNYVISNFTTMADFYDKNLTGFSLSGTKNSNNSKEVKANDNEGLSIPFVKVEGIELSQDRLKFYANVDAEIK